jgi:hypothetical protein
MPEAQVQVQTATQLPFTPDDTWIGDVRFYHLDPPLGGADYVLVSAVHADDNGPDETVIFPAFEDGEVIFWMAWPGTPEGIYDHKAALNAAGYAVIALEDSAS